MPGRRIPGTPGSAAPRSRLGARETVFVGSLCDVFEDRRDLDDARARVWKVIEHCTSIDFLLLTKRPQNIRRLAPWGAEWPGNVWMGVTAENQEMADARVPHLIEIPAPVRFVSVEPMLGPVDFSNWPGLIDWLIVGGESGTKTAARPVNVAWVRALRDQSVRMGMAFFLKQWGEAAARPRWNVGAGENTLKTRTGIKHRALLDAQLWDQFPVVRWMRKGKPLTSWERLDRWDDDLAAAVSEDKVLTE